MMLWAILRISVDKWNDDRVATMAAAISYYMIFAIGPSLLVFLFIIGIIYSDVYAMERLIEQVSLVAGNELGEALYNLINSLRSAQAQGLAGVFGFVLLFLTAFGFINEIRMSLITIWQARSKVFRWRDLFKSYFRNILALNLVGVFWVVYILVGDGLRGLGDILGVVEFTTTVTPLFQILVTTLLLFSLHKILVYSKIPPKPLLLGTFVTSIFLHLSFAGLSYYITLMFRSPFYGVAGTVVLTMFWLYLCAQICLFGSCLSWSICKLYKPSN